MNKSLIVLVLILIIAAQLTVLYSFHEVDNATAEVSGNAVLTLVKWNYVDASLTISFRPMYLNASAADFLEIICPNGSSINLTATSPNPLSQTFTERFSFQKTGDFNNPNLTFDNGKLSLGPNQPLDMLFNSDVGNVQTYISQVSAQTTPNYGYPLDIYTFVFYGCAQVMYSGCGVTI